MSGIDTERFNVLLQGYLQQNLSDEDLSEFFDMLRDEQYQPLLQASFADDLANNRFSGLSDTQQASIAFEALKQKMPVAEGPAERKLIFMKRWARVAAAVFIIGAGFLGYRLLKEPQPRQTADELSVITKDIAPGGNKALLMLGDGSTITLDNAQTGSLALQAGAEVVKSDSGKIVYHSHGSKETVYNSVITPKGGLYQITLPDGSNVWLNSLSSIKFPTAFSGDRRKVEVTGEAYFEVAHNAAKPFVVVVNDMTVEVLGTHFNVNAYPDEATVQTTLLEGSVKVSQGKKTGLLEPGQQARISHNADDVQIVSGVDLGQVVAWKNGFFNFNKADIGSIMRQLARWYDIEVDYSGLSRKEIFWGGIDKNLPLSSVLKILEKNQLHFRMENKTLILHD